MTSPSESYAEFDASLKDMLKLVAGAAARGYQLRHKNYRKLYLKRSRRLYRALADLDESLRDTIALSMLAKIDTRLQPIFNAKTDTQEMKKTLSSLKPALSELQKYVERSSESEFIQLDTKPYDAFKKIEGKVANSKKDVLVVDAYLDETVFALYFEKVPKNVPIRALTLSKKLSPRIKAIATKFAKQRKRFELRVSDLVHDRYLVVDDRIWLIGQSLKDAGNKPLAIVEMRDVPKAKAMLQGLWTSSTKVVP